MEKDVVYFSPSLDDAFYAVALSIICRTKLLAYEVSLGKKLKVVVNKDSYIIDMNGSKFFMDIIGSSFVCKCNKTSR